MLLLRECWLGSVGTLISLNRNQNRKIKRKRKTISRKRKIITRIRKTITRNRKRK